jgi:transposase
VSDKLKANVKQLSRYEPDINRTYQDLANHCGCVVLPTRIIKPRDRAKVEEAVQIIERIVLAELRHKRVFSLVH